MKPIEKQVSRAEFEKFLKEYPRPLERDVYAPNEPPLVTYNDFTLGVWPHSIVASTYLYDDNPEGYFYESEEDRKYKIVTNHEELFADKESILRHQEPGFKSHIVIVPDEVLRGTKV